MKNINIILIVLLICILIIGSIILVLLLRTKDCGSNLLCFENSAIHCGRATVNLNYADNIVRLTSKGIWFGKCELSLKIEKLSASLALKYQINPELANGMTLNCAIPQNLFNGNPSEYVNEMFNANNNFDQYCSGPIKDILMSRIK